MDAEASSSQPELHPIACESCRNKKSKCDRDLPTCSQCASSGISCRYPPIHKRGIPSGYISFLEQRLLQTELLAFELLAIIYQSRTPIDKDHLHKNAREAIADFSIKQPKSAKIEEWRRFPLTTKEQRKVWWRSKEAIAQRRSPSILRMVPHIAEMGPNVEWNQPSQQEEGTRETFEVIGDMQGTLPTQNQPEDSTMQFESELQPWDRTAQAQVDYAFSHAEKEGIDTFGTIAPSHALSANSYALGGLEAQMPQAEYTSPFHGKGARRSDPRPSELGGESSSASAQWRKYF
ncbi:hypothetical protein BCR34DRAFT_573826 [Clohesyomyces aquaticus]|uniref:Zn(2)-C6 fungal-type domain-containing protein n=1 Tax=Clohesyomyces aquaticus TaxID=1231657 RepID=A0A1Y1YZE7_9PLEO|nr:hypothetical protein BCR34DRAFT_573826 [Clohesyomyces aquaticus]